MPEFRYSVIDANGQRMSGVLEAENTEICRKIIAQRGLYCINVTPVSLASRSLNIGGKYKIKLKELGVFCRQFATMLSSGIGIIKSLDILHSQMDNPKFKSVIKKVYEAVQRGQSLSAAFKAQNGSFPDLLINMVEAGEASGTIERVMERVSDHFEKSLKTSNKVKNAMMYPIILASLTVGVVTMLMIFVMPVFVKMFEQSNVELPPPTKVLVALSYSMTHFWYVYLIVISLAAIIFMNFLKNEKGKLAFDKFKTTMPMIGKLNIIVISASFARTLSTMMQSGIPLIKSLEITAKVLGNKYFEGKVTEISEDIKKGVPMSMAIKKASVFPIMLLSMITIGEESGTLDEVLHKTAVFYDEESDAAISKMVGLLEPLMIIIMAAVVGFVVVSIIMPIFGMMKTVQ